MPINIESLDRGQGFIYQTIVVEALANNASLQDTVVIPDGYSRLAFIQFDPSLDLRLTVLSTKSKIEFVSGATLKQINQPWLVLNAPIAVDDRWILKITNRSGNAVSTAVSAVFV